MIRRVLLALLVSLSGCLGHNALVHKVLKFNLSTADGRWGREGLFLGMWIVPVYPLCTIADLLVLNSIEFWSGKNPVNGGRALTSIPRSEIEKLRLEGVEVAGIERLSETQAVLYVRFENGDRITFDVLRDGEDYRVSYGGIEFFAGKIRL